jgi:DNA-binding XRE family transcriptional regulator
MPIPLIMSHNHLRRYRKRGALTQEETAFLLGGNCGTKVSRLERGARAPSLQTALAYQAVFNVSVHELFPGEFQEAVTAVQGRAAKLSRKLEGKERGQQSPFKAKHLASIGAKTADISTQHYAR